MMVRDEFENYRADERAQNPTDAEFHRLVERIVREELQQVLAGADRLERMPTQSDILAILQWLAPFVRETIVDALRLGLTLHAGAAAQPVEVEADETDASANLPPLADFATAFTSARLRDLQQATGIEAGVKVADDPYDGPVADGVAEGAATTLLSGHVTLLVSPFEGFADVQRFLHDLSRIPRIFDVKPKRFTGGRLYITFGTEHADTQALADVLATELAPYRPVLRSVQSDFLEILLHPNA